MKRNHKISIIAAALMAGIISCKKDFLEEKRDLGGVNEEVYKDSLLATAYVDFVYGLFQPPDNAQSLSWNIATGDIKFAQTTEEFPSETNWNKPWSGISYVNGHALDYFGAPLEASIKNNTWTRIRECNLFLDNVDKYGLPDNVRSRLKGQIYFWRAYQYFDLVRLYGGVPLVLHAQDPINAEGNESLKIPRSSTTETFNQVYSDLDSAISMLPGRWLIDNNAQWGRITKGGAMAFKGRVALTQASPLFNRGENGALWQKAYEINKAARDYLITQGFGLYKTGNLSNGTAFENMFSVEAGSSAINPEAVIVFAFNTVTADQVKKNNGWENAARPKEINGGGSLTPTRQMLDAFPMKDGTPAGAKITTDSLYFYKNRDPRFYKTFAINGQQWPYSGNGNWRLWNYKWFANASEALPSRTTETKGANSTGIYIRKGTAANASNTTNGSFATNGNDFMELRFAEVLLNLAEAAAATGNEPEAIQLLGQIRERAGIT
ncbi:MAG TPA: RagB/SusD family nutrient uptake outer membrane protein, partial [Niastella sp.]